MEDRDGVQTAPLVGARRAVRGISGGAMAAAAVALLLSVTAGCEREAEEPEALPDSVRDAIRSVENSYVRAWESNDPGGVLSTFTDRAVIVPGTLPPVRGDSAMRAFWWPSDGTHTRVSSYETSIEAIGGWGSVAYMGGRGRLTFEWRASSDAEWQSYSTRSVWLALLRRQPDGQWKMTHRMWHQLEEGS